MRVANGILSGVHYYLLPVGTVNSVQTLKAELEMDAIALTINSVTALMTSQH
jgi:hypothetical protein